MARVFVTGGNGFVGRHVVKELIGRGHDVVSYDLVSAQDPLKGVTYRLGTIMDRLDMAREMKGCDLVIHLAAVIGVKRATKELLNCLNVNIGGTVTVLEATLMAGVENVLVTSSSEVFGDSGSEAYHETSPFNPKSAYAVSKLAGEEYALGFSREFGLKHRVVRFFNVYGPGQSPEFVMPIFANRAVLGQPLEVYGDGSQIRAFCNVRDAARGTVDVALSPDTAGETFNIGNDEAPVTMLELANLFAEVGKMAPDSVKQIAFQESDRTASREIYRRVPNISKMRKVFDYKPKVALREGVAELIDLARQTARA
jgi:UDP-glucose 4-epimerase